MEQNESGSVFDMFESHLPANYQISSLREFMSTEEKLIPADQAIKLSDGQLSSSFCQLRNNSKAEAKIEDMLRLNGIPLSAKNTNCAALKQLCSDAGRQKTTATFMSKMLDLSRKYNETAYIACSKIPELCHSEPNGMISLRTSESSSYQLIQKARAENIDLSTYNMRDAMKMGRNATSADRAGIEKLNRYLKAKYPKFLASLAPYNATAEKLDMEMENATCNVNALDSTLTDIKKSLLEKARNTPAAKACQNFHI